MGSTKFWEVAGLLLGVVQLTAYLIAFKSYADGLHDLADDLREKANERFAKYLTLRGKDEEFWDAAKNLPDYSACGDAVKMAKGAAFAEYAINFKRLARSVRGFTPMQKVSLVNAYSAQPLSEMHVARAITSAKQAKMGQDANTRSWAAIVSAPTNPAHSNDVSNIIQSSFSTLRAFGQGANSAGLLIGKSAYNLGF